jgi:hypothetical protein
VPADIKPAALAQLVDFAERPRVRDWSLRAALVRYAQPQPQRVEALLEVIRRIDFVLTKNSKSFERSGDEIWRAVERGDDGDQLVQLLRVTREIDALGDELAAWAVALEGARPDDDVDRVTRDAARRLDDLGVPREERPPNRQRGV